LNKKISNVDTLSALFDRLITERIKHYFFVKEGNAEKVAKQIDIILEIKTRIADTFDECFEEYNYEYFLEQRTFNQSIIENVEKLILCNLNIGEGDREKLSLINGKNKDIELLIEQEIRVRTANEGRSYFKNLIDKIFSVICRRK